MGCPVMYQPDFQPIMNNKVYGTSIDNRGGCAILIRVAEILKEMKRQRRFTLWVLCRRSLTYGRDGRCASVEAGLRDLHRY
ncbi:hypothetical protein [Cohnella faecalis]|uniref:hypothetical protein n=1 Tax=Cohnella faecalis TaxID=2315694 RepID=UPI003988D3C4